MNEILRTLLHEMVHLDNLAKGIKDCSNNNVYHNKKFKEAAEAVGFIVEKTDRYGWSNTQKCNATTEYQLDNLQINRDVFSIYRIPVLKPAGDKEKTSSFKYSCPKCGVKFTLKKDLELVCKLCGVEFVVEEKKPKIEIKSNDEQ